MVKQVNNSDLSPIYRTLYNKVTALPSFCKLAKRARRDLHKAKVLDYTYNQTRHGFLQCHSKVLVGTKVCAIKFRISDKIPSFYLAVDHLVRKEEVDNIYLKNVGEGKPIQAHGLVRLSTVLDGARPHDKNKFSSFACSKILNAKEFLQLKKRIKYRIYHELMNQLRRDPFFIQLSEDLAIKSIIEKLMPHSNLPPEVLHRAVDLVYIKKTMEQ